MKPLPVAPALLAILLTTLAGCTSTTVRSDDVIAVLHAQQDAWNRGDLEAFAELGYWRSPELTFFSGGDVTKGYDGLIERYTARYASPEAEMGTLAFSELEVIELGPDLAVVRGHWQLERERLDDIGGLFTLLLRQTPDGWRIVHDHTSAADPPEPGT